MKNQKKEVIISQIPTQDYIQKFRDVDKFVEFCKKCNNYNTMWSCPPFEPQAYNCIEKFSEATIIGVKINIDQRTRFLPTDTEQRNSMIRDILSEVRGEFDAELLSLEQKVDDSLLYYAGSCRICYPEKCKRSEGKPCRYPEKMRSTLEAIGFDMGRTTSELLGVELKWCEGNELPEYFTLVYGFLTNQNVVDQIKTALENIDNVTSIKI